MAHAYLMFIHLYLIFSRRLLRFFRGCNLTSLGRKYKLCTVILETIYRFHIVSEKPTVGISCHCGQGIHFPHSYYAAGLTAPSDADLAFKSHKFSTIWYHVQLRYKAYWKYKAAQYTFPAHCDLYQLTMLKKKF